MNVVAQFAAAIALAAAFAAQMARWLRVLQREHYEPKAVARFLGRWTSPPASSAKALSRRQSRRPFTPSYALMIALAAAILLRNYGLVVVITALYGIVCPWGLSIRGTTGPLQWTRRLRAVGAVVFAFSLVAAGLGALSPEPTIGAVVVVWAVPPLIDVSTRLRRPFERRRAAVFVRQAVARLAAVQPRIVAITGSYGKTSTKHHLVEIMSGEGVVASPRSFNNEAGLSRSINEHLADGTRVFVAEMGTYGPGEIRALTSWCTPEIAVVTAIGPVHLERMRTLDVVESAKREITERATTVVLNVDDERLALWAEPLTAAGTHVLRAGSSSASLDVCVAVEGSTWRVLHEGRELATLDEVRGVQPTNLACALAAALALGVAPEELGARARLVTPVANRLNVLTAPSGVVVVDDTFNANPASAVVALRTLASLEVPGTRYVVTPGLVELGVDQYPENLRLGQRVASIDAHLVIVARTNAVALRTGYAEDVRRFNRRAEAVAWVRSALRDGDAVLYLNDLPDHYP